jgi:hypothetical protein
MTDRTVTLQEPIPRDSNGSDLTKPFSAFAEVPNIILLGDPGAGKSHLFEAAARASGDGRFFTVRSFLNLPADEAVETVFIDALDETRSGPGDDEIVDQIVRKLYELRPKQVRLSCRVADWLGGSDLDALKDYFTQIGAYAVLRLEPLSPDEQVLVLSASGVADPAAFLAEAQERDLHEFLDNPQNLILLAEAVQDENWPETRTALFETASFVLMKEKNSKHTRKRSAEHSAATLMAAAGRICALRLISDVEGLALPDGPDATDFPSYLTVDPNNSAAVLTALGRRVFRAGAEPGTVDYSHRTTAEFLAAKWLAAQVRGGLPLGRLKALIWSDGGAPSALRGLNAWLAIWLQEHAGAFIRADPYGVLTYGDAKALPREGRMALLVALGAEAERHGGFQTYWFPSSTTALVGSDLVEDLRAILRDKARPVHLRVLIGDALAKAPLAELTEDFAAVLLDRGETLRLRGDALKALANLGPSGLDRLARLYDDLPDSSPDDFRLRCATVDRLYPERFETERLGELIWSAFSNSEDSTISLELDQTVAKMSVEALVSVLDDLAPRDWPNKWHEKDTTTLDNLLSTAVPRILKEAPGLATGQRLFAWRGMFNTIAHFDSPKIVNEIATLIFANKRVMGELAEVIADYMAISNRGWSGLYRGLQAEPDNRLIFDALIARWETGRVHDNAREDVLYWLASTARNHAESDRMLAELEALAVEESKLHEILHPATRAVEVDPLMAEWAFDDAMREAERENRHRDVVNDLSNRLPGLRDGTDRNGLGELAVHYWFLNRRAPIRIEGLDQGRPRIERIETLYNAEIAEAFTAGCAATLSASDLPTVDALLATWRRAEATPNWLFEILCGLEEHFQKHGTFEGIPELALALGMALENNHDMQVFEGNTLNRGADDWRLLFASHHPDIYANTLRKLLDYDLTIKRWGSGAVFALTDETSEALGDRRVTLLLEAIEAHPLADLEILKRILWFLLPHSCARERLAVLANDVLAGCFGGPPNWYLWTAIGLLTAPETFVDRFKAAIAADRGVVWLLRCLWPGSVRTFKGQFDWFPVNCLSVVVLEIASRYPNSPHPGGVRSGNRNSRDASEFVVSVIRQLGNHTSEAAVTALQTLLEDPGLESYLPTLKHTLAETRTRLRDSRYRQPGWEQARNTLTNLTPSNAADLRALTAELLRDAGQELANANGDGWKTFYNLDGYSRPTDPIPEEAARDRLMDRLRPRLAPLGITVEPESHMARDTRADMLISIQNFAVPVEIKRDYHPELWTAIDQQLIPRYARDPRTDGNGIYLVFWYGTQRGKVTVPAPPDGSARPNSAEDLRLMLEQTVPPAARDLIEIVVLDISGT